MRKSTTRSYSRYTQDATLLLGRLIRIARKERKLTAQEVAERAGISRGLMQRIEKGDLKCEIGATFEVATIVGIKLFDIEGSINKQLRHTEDKLTLLPKSIRKTKPKEVYDDF